MSNFSAIGNTVARLTYANYYYSISIMSNYLYKLLN